MTTANPQRSVLVIGASQHVLDETVAALRDLGYTAQATSDFASDLTSRFDITHIGLVSLGGRVPPDRKAELRQQIAAINPRVIVLDSLAGIPGLIASQVQEAFASGRQGSRLHARRPLDPADPRRPGSGQGDPLVADLNHPAGSQERLARPARAPAPQRRPQDSRS